MKNTGMSSEWVKRNSLLRKTKEIGMNPWKYPTDVFMKELTCEVIWNVVKEAGSTGIGWKPTANKKRLRGIIRFAKGRDYWWNCLELFAPSVDRKKIREKIIITARATIKKINKLT